MYRGKRAKSTKSIYIMASVVLLIALAVGGTLAYIATKTSDVVNTFTLGTVPIKVEEDITTEAGVKKDVKIKNEGTVDAYIRAKVIVNWVSKTDNSVVYGQTPVLNEDYSISYGDTWQEVGGYYYHKGKVAPNKSTNILFTNCGLAEGADAPDGYTLSVEILAQSIQAGTSEQAIIDAWGVNPTSWTTTNP